MAKVDPSIVTITLDNQSLGSGFIVDPTGLVATNYHVIEGAKWAMVAFPDKRTASVDGFLAIDPTRDLALLHITMHTGKSVDHRVPVGRFPSIPDARSLDGTDSIPSGYPSDDRIPMAWAGRPTLGSR